MSRRAIISIAESYIGYLEKKTNAQLENFTANAGSGNYTLFGQWYGAGWNGQPWCAMFVSYCADKAGVQTSIIPKHASCSVGVSWFKRVGRWHDRAGYTPEPGDIIYFTQNGKTAAHVGIVTKVDKNRVYTVEGNTSGGSTLIANGGGVAAKSYLLAYDKILGYGHPGYEEDEDLTPEKFAELYDHLNPMIKTIDDPKLPASLRPEVQKLLDTGAINGGTPFNVNAKDINMRLDTLKAIIVAKR
jgi:hypothetical protein